MRRWKAIDSPPVQPIHQARMNSRSSKVAVCISRRMLSQWIKIASILLALVALHAPAFATGVSLYPLRSDPEGITGFDVVTGPKDVSMFIWWGLRTQLNLSSRLRHGDVWNPSVMNTLDEGAILQSKYSKAVSDGSRIYYFAGGQLGFKAYIQRFGTSRTILSEAPLLNLGSGSTLEVYDDQIVWASYNGTNSWLYSMPKAGGFVTTLGLLEGRIKKIKGFQELISGGTVLKSVAFLTDSGRLYHAQLGTPSSMTIYEVPNQVPLNYTDFDIMENPDSPGKTLLYAVTGREFPTAPPTKKGKLIVYDGTGQLLNWRSAATHPDQIVDIAVGNGQVWTIQTGEYNCSGYPCVPGVRKIVLYNYILSSGNPEKLNLNYNGGVGRDLTYTSEGFMIVGENSYYDSLHGDTIYLLMTFADTLTDPPKRMQVIKKGDAK